MIYTGWDEGYRKIVFNGAYKGFYYYIISLGSHPCCYVEIPKEHKLYGVAYCNYTNDECIEVHGGITYTESYLQSVNGDGTSWFIGWDYAHAGDYIYFNNKTILDGHKWTIEELKNEVIDVIEQLSKIGDD